ncbi:glutamate-rich protein 3-like isoform X2 [Lineus longissimus]|uniref:glutamate-rich protein 3-like isoform X2 n=1 Tax=Lineus longissimus TaxID=88925 RepID=UPI00315DC3E5
MSHIDAGPLSTYNSLMDKHLAGYFSNSKMRRHLKKSGLITRRGEIVTQNQYRHNMAKKEHKQHVKDLLAQAIVHKTLDMERMRQVAIKKKLEEIAKIELVRRVKTDRRRQGDEDILPYLSPRPNSASQRPKTSPARGRPKDPYSRPDARLGFQEHPDSSSRRPIYIDAEGQPISPRDEKYPKEEIDTRHLYGLDNVALREYTMTLDESKKGKAGASPYVQSQLPDDAKIPSPPRTSRSVQSAGSKRRLLRPMKQRGTLHRQEPPMTHPSRLQSLCEVTIRYHGENLQLAHEVLGDPRHEVLVEQQHCGGNTLIVYKDLLMPGTDFQFLSRRHRGYPFSLTFYVNGVMSARLSTCCEFKHTAGCKIGGKQGHFGLVAVSGGLGPCYKCQVEKQVKESQKKKKQPKPAKEEKAEPEENEEEEDTIICPVEDDEDAYGDDFEDDDDERSASAAGPMSTVASVTNGPTIDVAEDDEEYAESTLDEAKNIDVRPANSPRSAAESTRSTRSTVSSPSSSSSSSSSSDEEDYNKDYGDDFDDTESDAESTAKTESSAKVEVQSTTEGPSEVESNAETDKVDEGDTDKTIGGTTDDEQAQEIPDDDDEKDTDIVVSPRESESARESDVGTDVVEDEEEVAVPVVMVTSAVKEAAVEDETSASEVAEDGESEKAESERVVSENEASEVDEVAEEEEEEEKEEPEIVEKKKDYEDDFDDDDDDDKSSKKDKDDEKDGGAGGASGHSGDSSSDAGDDESVQEEPEDDGKKGGDEKGKASGGEHDQDEGVLSSDTEVDEKSGKVVVAADVHASDDEKVESVAESETEEKKDVAVVVTSAPESPRESMTSPKEGVTSPRESVTSPRDSSPTSSPESAVSSPREASPVLESPPAKEPEPETADETGAESDISDTEGDDADAEPDYSSTSDTESRTGTGSESDVGAYLALKSTTPTLEPVIEHPGSISTIIDNKPHVDLSSIQLNKTQVKELCEDVAERDDIQSVVVRNGKLDDKSIGKLTESILATPSEVKMLNFNLNRITPEGAKHVSTIVKERPKIQVLLLHGNPLGDDGVKEVVDAVEYLKIAAEPKPLSPVSDVGSQESTRSVESEEGTPIRSAAKDLVKGVMDDVMRSPSFQELQPGQKFELLQIDLGDTTMGNAGASHVARMIAFDTPISTLNLTGNMNIKRAGWQSISEALKHNTHLRVLTLDYTMLGDEGVEILAEALKQNTTLRTIDLEGNFISDKGGDAILDLLSVNKSIQDVTVMPGNKLSEEKQSQIKDALDARKSS